MTRFSFMPTREAGLARLSAFAPAMGRHYAETRNYDHGPEDRSNLSLLSPYVRHRLIEERELAEMALAHHSASAADKFLKEVCWRTYWKGWLAHRPAVWQQYESRRDALISDLARDKFLRRRYEAAIAGATGIDGFDEWVLDLAEEGYLANHARMWFASIWISTLRLPWELGADFFLRHLMDADAASNTLSWRWVAGLHTPGKTYLARGDNIAAYTNDRYRPAGLAGRADAIEGFSNPPPKLLNIAGPAPEGRVALMLTDEDLCPETLIGKGTQVTAIAGLHFAARRSPLPTGEAALAFTRGALADGLSRASRQFEAPGTDLSVAADPLEACREWALGLDVDVIITAQPATGWTAAALGEIRGALETTGKRLAFAGRDWDAAFWPHASKGFFALGAKIPETLEALGIGAQARLL
jgi:deoxyribodipyrimidine photo-lyase